MCRFIVDFLVLVPPERSGPLPYLSAEGPESWEDPVVADDSRDDVRPWSRGQSTSAATPGPLLIMHSPVDQKEYPTV